MEHGRALLWTGLLDLRGDLSEVTARWPRHADRLARIRRELDASAERGRDASETIGQLGIEPSDGV
ncbi:hypothetical protein ACIBL3_41035 [Kribbella sp. NPDC050124]|uniref:hypothetical protein n=1 Tax=Kribbella sp. NPDC050124 TaxID=3364114 RepID=UPI0037AB14D2